MSPDTAGALIFALGAVLLVALGVLAVWIARAPALQRARVDELTERMAREERSRAEDDERLAALVKETDERTRALVGEAHAIAIEARKTAGTRVSKAERRQVRRARAEDMPAVPAHGEDGDELTDEERTWAELDAVTADEERGA